MGVVIKSTYVFTYREFIDFAEPKPEPRIRRRFAFQPTLETFLLEIVLKRDDIHTSRRRSMENGYETARRGTVAVAWPGGCDSRLCYLFGSITL